MSFSNKPFERDYAVVIGISDYGNGIPSLKTAVNDAKALAELLETQHHYKTTRLIDAEATLTRLRDYLQTTLKQTVQPNDRLLFYFAGHGIALNQEADGPQGYLIPQDGKLGDSASYLPMHDVAQALLDLPCRHCLVILDCCFAGTFHWASTRKLTPFKEIVYKERYDRFVQDRAWQVITSASHDQEAWDSLKLIDDRGGDADATHSPFAAALIDALEGQADRFPAGNPSGDGVVTATELYMYVRDQVEVKTNERNGRQTPQLWHLEAYDKENKRTKGHDKGEYIFLTRDEIDLPPAPRLDVSQNPYRGLEAFDTEHQDLFFGRTALTEELYKQVVQQSLTVVLGASGSGKSSLVKAGLIPYLQAKHRNDQERWTVLPPFRPGESPFKALNLTLESVDLPTVIPSCAISSDHSTSAQCLADWFSQHPQNHLLVVIDQFEELVTLCNGDEAKKQEREKFLHDLTAAIQAYPTQFHLVLTLRSDFESQFCNTTLKDYWQSARFIVPAMQREELREAIEKPASARVVYFEPHGLVDQLIDEVAQMPGALPLLSFALHELYVKLAHRYVEAQTSGTIVNRAITKQDYDELGGVTRSLTQRADQEYDELKKQDPAYAETIRHVMLRMVAVGGELARRRVLKTELQYADPAKNERAKVVVQRFSEARLLVNGTDAEGNPYIEPAHDVLVRGWQCLLEWKQTHLQTLLLQRELRPDAVKWTKSKQDKQATGFLWNNDPRLPQVKQIRDSQTDNWLNAIETEFIDQSLNQKRKNRCIRYSIFLTVSLVLAGIAAIAQIQKWDAEESRQQLAGQKLASQAEVVQENYDESIATSILLAVESLNFHESLAEGNNALLEGMNLLPPQQNLLNLKNIEKAVLSFDGRYLATVSEENKKQIFIWDYRSGTEIKRFNSEEDISAVAFSADNKHIAIANLKKGAPQILTIDGESKEKQFNYKNGINIVALNPNAEYLATANGEDNYDRSIVRVWKNGTEPPILLNSKGRVSAIAFSPDKTSIVVVSDEGKNAQIWTTNGENKTTLNPGEGILNVAYSQDGKYIVTTGQESVQIWEANTGHEVTRLLPGKKIKRAVFSPDSKYLATTSLDKGDGIVQVWEVSRGKEIARMNHEAGLFDLAFTANNHSVITVSRNGSVHEWKLNSQSEIARLEPKEQVTLEPKEQVTDVAYSPDGKYLVTVSGNSARIWDARRKSLIHQSTPITHDELINTISFSPNNKYIVSASLDGIAKVWEFSNGKVLRQVNTDLRVTESKASEFKGSILKATFSSDNKFIALASGNTAQIWEINTERKIFHIKHDKPVTTVAFSPDGKYLASASEDSTVRLWQISNAREVKRIDHTDAVQSIAFSENGKLLATASGKSAQIWNLADYSRVGRTYHEKSVNTVAFSPDDEYLATASLDGTVRLWNIKNQQEEKQVNYDESVRDIAFSPDGKFLAAASGTTAQIWLYSDQSLTEKACTRVGRNLTAIEWERFLNRPLEQYQKTCPNLPIEPSVIEEGKELLKRGKLQAAHTIFHTVLPDLELTNSFNFRLNFLNSNSDLTTSAKTLISLIELKKGQGLMDVGDVTAVAAFEEARSFEPNLRIITEPEIFNDFCWFGSINKQADKVMFACNKAIELAPKNGQFYESRGLAKAMLNDRSGAIDDLCTSIELTSNKEEKQQRQGWLDTLQAGKNPFTDAELNKLKRGS